MVVTSFYFLIFLLAVIIVYLILPQRIKPWLILAASLLFYYFWKPWAPVFIVAFALFNYFMALVLAKHKNKRKLFFLLLSISISVILFFVFRYKILDSILAALSSPGGTIAILFPLGFSYYMFKCISYLLDVNNATMQPVRRFDHFLVYVTYFPEVSMGPITRAVDFIPQISQKKTIDAKTLNQGLALVAWGFLKKIVFADRLATLIAPYFNDVSISTSGFAWFLVAFGFLLQLYIDFSAYTDISVGVSKMLGYEIKHNFNAPFFAKSIAEFWRKWHISLSSWLSDYVFSPLQFYLRRLGKLASVIGALVTFTIIGIWHGGTLSYLVFGFSMGILVAIDSLIAKQRKKVKKKLPQPVFNTISMILTLFACIIVFVFMRIPQAADGFRIIANIFSFGTWAQSPGFGAEFFIVIGIAVIVTLASHLIEQRRPSFLDGFSRLKMPFAGLIYLVVVFAIILFGYYGPGYDPIDFIYMGF